MKKFSVLGLIACWVVGLTFTGCKKADTTSATSAQLSFDVQSDSPASTLASVNTNGNLTTFSTLGSASVNWTGATANVSKFKFDAKKDGAAFEVVASGLTNIDLFAINPSTISAIIPNGTYTAVELHVLLAKSTTTALPLVVKGSYTTKGGTIIPIEFDFNEDAEIVALTNDLTIDGKNDVLAHVSLHLNKLLSNVSAQEIDQTTRTNSTILITSTINAAIYTKIKADLMLSGGSSVVTVPKK